MKRNYYYLVAGLQDIVLDSNKLSMGQVEFRDELRNELHPDDYRLLEILFYPFDNLNLLNLLQKSGKVPDQRGVIPIDLMEESIKETTGLLPPYMDQFINAFKDDEPVVSGMSPENQLTSLFYSFAESVDNSFLSEWFVFNRTLGNLMTALMCRKYDIPYDNQVIGNDEISETIRRSNARDFGLTAEISWMEDILNIAKNEDIQEREKALDNLKWKYLDDATFFEYFTVNKVLAFVIKLGMVERWLVMDKDHGMDLFMDLLKELKSSYKLPESFTEK